MQIFSAASRLRKHLSRPFFFLICEIKLPRWRKQQRDGGVYSFGFITRPRKPRARDEFVEFIGFSLCVLLNCSDCVEEWIGVSEDERDARESTPFFEGGFGG